MTLVKLDHPRRIDRIIDYFGEPRPAAGAAARPWGGADRWDYSVPARREPERSTVPAA